VKVIIDTNVPIVANGHSTQASQACSLACIQRIRRITTLADTLVLDDKRLILKQYMDNLRSEGQPGVGDAFLKWVLTNLWARCEQVAITLTVDGSFEEFPEAEGLKTFDLKDRVFVAVALAHSENPPIVQAVDPGFWKHREALAENSVQVEFICEEDIKRLAETK